MGNAGGHLWFLWAAATFAAVLAMLQFVANSLAHAAEIQGVKSEVERLKREREDRTRQQRNLRRPSEAGAGSRLKKAA